MTIQNWSLCPEAATIVCDTIATDMATNRPVAFVSKAWVIPHRSLMLASLAWAYPVTTLYSNLALGMGPQRDTDLPAYAANVLRAAAAQHERQDWHVFAEVVMFGWDEAANTIQGWRFFPFDDYRVEMMKPNRRSLLRPEPLEYVDDLDRHQVALQQQAEDREVSMIDRDNIGGSLIGYEMRIDKEGRPPQIIITNYGRMPHYDEQASNIRSHAQETSVAAFDLPQNG